LGFGEELWGFKKIVGTPFKNLKDFFPLPFQGPFPFFQGKQKGRGEQPLRNFLRREGIFIKALFKQFNLYFLGCPLREVIFSLMWGGRKGF